MSILESLMLFGIMLALAVTPSASVGLVVTRSATLGLPNGLAVSAGIVLGDLVFILLAVFGLTLVAETMGSLFFIIKVLGGLYLLWLGYSLLKTKKTDEISVSQINHKRGVFASFITGFLLTLADIKAIFFYASLLPMFIDLSQIKTAEIVAIMLLTIFSVGGVKAAYALSANKIASLAQDSKIAAITRKTAGSMMIGAGGYLILRA